MAEKWLGICALLFIMTMIDPTQAGKPNSFLFPAFRFPITNDLDIEQ